MFAPHFQTFSRVVHRLTGALWPSPERRRETGRLLRQAAAAWLGVERPTVWIHCDYPGFAAGQPLTLAGVIELPGWALASRGIGSVTIACDDVPVAEATIGIPRADVAALSAQFRQSVNCGFRHHLDTRRLSPGAHTLSLVARDHDGLEASISCPVQIQWDRTRYEHWRDQTDARPAALAWMRRVVPFLPERFGVRLALTLRDVHELPAFLATRQSLIEQAYPFWHLAICDESKERAASRRMAELELPADERVRWLAPDALPAVNPLSADLHGELRPGQVLTPDALFELVYAFNRWPESPAVTCPMDWTSHTGRYWQADGAVFGLTRATKDQEPPRAVRQLPRVLCSQLAETAAQPMPESADLTPPTLLTHAPFPLIPSEQIRRILVLKLDHLGDVYLALPALRRLSELFPRARITALVGPWACSLLEQEPAVAEVLTYEFFQAASSQHPNDLLGDEAYLRDLLRSRNFDLAVDLRREPETREILRLSGAPYTAGFCRGDCFDWLTLGLQTEYNVAHFEPTWHTAQELLHLVEMIGIACQEIPAAPAFVDAGQRTRVRQRLRTLLQEEGRLVLAIHPGSGRPIKCWPIPHFAMLARRLHQELGAAIVFLGSAEEVPLVQQIQAHLATDQPIASLAGELNISELQALFCEIDGYIGNDSGPTHLAAGAGIPTLCISSGTNSAKQWAPIGPWAASLHRAIACAPCYLRVPEECCYQIACLRELDPESAFEAMVRLLLPRWSQFRAARPATDGLSKGATSLAQTS